MPEVLSEINRDILAGTHVYITDYHIKEFFCSIPGVSVSDFHYSKPVHSHPGGYLFPKKKRPVVQKLFDNIGWVNAFSILHYYDSLNDDSKDLLTASCMKFKTGFIRAI